MNQIVDNSKVIPPLLPKIIERPRLTDLLAEHRDRRLIFIKGPAAYGKTTLAASYVKSLETRSVWVMLEPEDSDSINLYYTLVQALQYTFHEIDFKPHFSYPAISVGPRQEIPLYREWVHVLFDALQAPLQIVIDDLHSLVPDSPSLQFINVLLAEAPPEVRFIMLSREEQPIGLQKMKIRRNIYVLPQEQLAFTTNEIHKFFSDICNISLSQKTINHIHNFSEGWIGGVVLLSDHLKMTPVEKWDNSLSGHVPNRLLEDVFPYFGEEIFNAQSVSIQDVLLQLAIFDFIDPEFAKDFLSVKKGVKILDDIVKMNLFVTVYDDIEGRRTIRFHNLFREFLIKQLKSRVEEDELNSLYIKAGNLFEKRGDFENAIKFYLKAKAYPTAASAIVRVGMKLIQMNRMFDLSSWLKVLPVRIVEENPWLLYYRSITVRFTESKDNIFRLHKALTLLTERGDIGGQLLVLGLLIESSLLAGEDLTPMPELIEKSELLLESIGADQYIFEKASLLLALGFVYPLRACNSTKGCWANHNAYLIFKQLNIPQLQIYALSNLFLTQQMMGNISDAEENRQKIDWLLKKHDHPELKALYSINLAQFYTVKGDLEKAHQYIPSAQEDAEELGLLYLYLPLLIQELMLLPHLGQFEKAEQVGEQLLQFSSSAKNVFFNGLAMLFLGINYYHKEDHSKAIKFVTASKVIFSSNKSFSLTHLVTSDFILGLINLQIGQYENSQKALNECTINLGQFGGRLWAAHNHFAKALLYWNINKADKTADLLRKGMKAIEHDECFHLQWMSRKDFTKVCLLTVELKVDKAIDYAEYLLVTHLSATASFGLDKLMHHSDKTIRRKVFTIRKKIYRSTLPHIQLRTLAEFEVFKDGEPVEAEEWQRKQAKMMLKVIVSRGSKNIPRDFIIEDLWPEVPADVGDKRFKVELHRLRKSLESGMDKEFGSSYIHLTDNLVSLDDDLCKVDADYFTDLICQGNKEKIAGKHRKAAINFQEAVDMYKGDFLAQDLYSNWAEQRRTELKKQYIETLFELGRIYEDRGTVFKAISCYTKAIESDPLLERAYQQLIVLYSAKGKRNQALQTYGKLKQTLQTEIQGEPEPFSKKLYEKIILSGLVNLQFAGKIL